MEQRIKKVRLTSYRYRCGRCGGMSVRGSNAKKCCYRILKNWKWSFCNGPLERVSTVKLKIGEIRISTGEAE